MVYGKTQTSFRLLTEETAIKWRLPVNSTAQTITAGMMVYANKTNAYVIAVPADTSLAAGFLSGIAMDSYAAALDETQGSGFITVVIGPHVGATSQYDAATAATTIGTLVCNPLTTAGKLTGAAASSNITKMGYVLNCDGVFLTYFWFGI